MVGDFWGPGWGKRGVTRKGRGQWKEFVSASGNWGGKGGGEDPDRLREKGEQKARVGELLKEFPGRGGRWGKGKKYFTSLSVRDRRKGYLGEGSTKDLVLGAHRKAKGVKKAGIAWAVKEVSIERGNISLREESAEERTGGETIASCLDDSKAEIKEVNQGDTIHKLAPLSHRV